MRNNKGFSVIEVLIAVSIITIAFVSFLGIVSYSLKLSVFAKKVTTANTLAQEMIEATRNFRDGTAWDADGLGTVSYGVDYYPSLTLSSPPAWDMKLGQETVGNFIRSIVFEKVSRDPATSRIENIYNASNDDPMTVKAIATVFFDSNNVQIETYFTNWQGL